ncbi:hypothetical protein LCGC14_1809390 [marine sediment metagenome]|uniref:Uncharacterized protein n=1 Tax=marine sediment metagenome TaxID=412755 RepID=A0A0F9J217_9ZZZZ
MEKSSTEKKGQAEKGATNAQFKLIRELMAETNSAILPEKYEGKILNSDKASECIQYLKDLKSRQYQERKNHETGVVFDKIGFGMVFKIVSRRAYEEPRSLKPTLDEFSDELNANYKIFKHCQEACRQFVADGGLK